MSGKRKACGVCTARKAARGGVASTRPSASTCLTVSLSGVPGAAAPWASAASTARATSSRDGNGPGGVVDEHDVGLCCGERLEAGEHALLAGRAADRGRPDRCRALRRQMRERLVIERAVVGDGSTTVIAGERPGRQPAPRAYGRAAACRRRADIASAARAPSRAPRPAATTTRATRLGQGLPAPGCGCFGASTRRRQSP